MSNKFQNLFRVKSSRLKCWDYNSCGGYFVTICVKDRRCVLGDINSRQMVIHGIGKEAIMFWEQIPKYFSHASIDEYVFMPNHMHGIIMIRRDAIHGVSINNSKNGGIVSTDKNPMLNNSLSTIIRWYKGRTTYEINKTTNTQFQWQPRFYEHIIRNDADLNRVREYIRDNPLNWDIDEENVDRINRVDA